MVMLYIWVKQDDYVMWMDKTVMLHLNETS